MVITFITGVILPVGSRFENAPEKPVSLYTEATLERTIIGAVRDLDKGTYRIGIAGTKDTEEKSGRECRELRRYSPLDVEKTEYVS